MQIEELKLSVRTYNCLKRARVNTVEELSTMADEDLLRFRNFGPKCLAEVRTVIAMPRKSRADRMREMTDEELADFWYNNYDGFCSNKPECGRIIDAGRELDERDCKGCILAWLRMPMEESR